MIHVPDVRLAAAWYESIGFTVERTHEDEGLMSWALVSFGSSEVMFNP
jgi:predicted lactoylglutathione lyase